MSDTKFATRLSLTFFLVGTILLVIYYFTVSHSVALLGYAYTGMAVLTGIIYLIVIGFKVIANKITKKTALKCAAIVMANFPFAALYLYFVLILMTTARITFENSTGQNITSVSIGGCTNKEIGELKIGESKTIWVHIKNDCSLVLFYKMDREPKLETAFGYLTPNMGMIATYKIGSK